MSIDRWHAFALRFNTSLKTPLIPSSHITSHLPTPQPLLSSLNTHIIQHHIIPHHPLTCTPPQATQTWTGPPPTSTAVRRGESRQRGPGRRPRPLPPPPRLRCCWVSVRWRRRRRLVAAARCPWRGGSSGRGRGWWWGSGTPRVAGACCVGGWMGGWCVCVLGVGEGVGLSLVCLGECKPNRPANIYDTEDENATSSSSSAPKGLDDAGAEQGEVPV
jgi:hypothetical protein